VAAGSLQPNNRATELGCITNLMSQVASVNQHPPAHHPQDASYYWVVPDPLQS
jgi:hypothetical protein